MMDVRLPQGHSHRIQRLVRIRLTTPEELQEWLRGHATGVTCTWIMRRYRARFTPESRHLESVNIRIVMKISLSAFVFILIWTYLLKRGKFPNGFAAT